MLPTEKDFVKAVGGLWYVHYNGICPIGGEACSDRGRQWETQHFFGVKRKKNFVS